MSLLRIRTINRVSLWEIRERAFPNDRVFHSLSLSFWFQDGKILCYIDLGYNRTILSSKFLWRGRNVCKVASREYFNKDYRVFENYIHSAMTVDFAKIWDLSISSFTNLKLFPSRLIGNIREFRKDSINRTNC